ncbi:MAG: hypothetical protein IJ958_03725 [Agathobacter sp.]|nr:hypothetical protein [Agathobacter sp.]
MLKSTEEKKKELSENPKEECFKEFVLRRSEELFGNEVYTREYNPICLDGFLKDTFLPEETGCCEIIVRPLKDGKELDLKSVIQLAQVANGECMLISDGGGYLRIDTVERLMKSGKCQLGIRNNRLSLYPDSLTESGHWIRVHDFSTKDKGCAEIFLKELHEFAKSKKDVLEKAENELDVKGFCAQVLKVVNEVFNESLGMTFPTEFYPSLDPEKSYCYEMFRIYLDENFFVEVHTYPDKDEFVCKSPSRYWDCTNKRNVNGTYGPLIYNYRDEIIKMENDFAKKMYELDSNCIIVTGRSKVHMSVEVGEFRTTDIEKVKLFLEELLENRKKSYLYLYTDMKKYPLGEAEERYRNYF